MRYAIYFTPDQHDPLTRAAARWLGRDPFGGRLSDPIAAGAFSAADIACRTAAPRRYGFHATLKAPFRLAENVTEGALQDAFDTFASTTQPVLVPRLALRRLDGFFALVPEDPVPALNALAASVVTAFETFRAPLSSAEIQRRDPEALTPGQLKNLRQWGYPYVFDGFRFHMTLTGRISDDEAGRMERVIETFFGPLLEEPLAVDALALFAETEQGGPMVVRSLRKLACDTKRKTA